MTSSATLVESSALSSLPQNSAKIAAAFVDRNELTRECILTAARVIRPLLSLSAFSNVAELLANGANSLGGGITIYFDREHDPLCLDELAVLVREFPPNRMVILSDREIDSYPSILGKMEAGSVNILNVCGCNIHKMLATLVLAIYGDRARVPASEKLSFQDTNRPLPKTSFKLSYREEQIFVLLRQGQSNKQIAHNLGASVSTIKMHMRTLLDKTNCSNRIQLATLRSWIGLIVCLGSMSANLTLGDFA